MGSLLYDRGEFESAGRMYEGCVRGMIYLSAAPGVPKQVTQNFFLIIDAHGAHLLESLRRMGRSPRAYNLGLELCKEWERLNGDADDRPRRIEAEIQLARADCPSG
jgi:hypothetical protein